MAVCPLHHCTGVEPLLDVVLRKQFLRARAARPKVRIDADIAHRRRDHAAAMAFHESGFVPHVRAKVVRPQPGNLRHVRVESNGADQRIEGIP